MEEDSGGAQTLTLIERDWQKRGRRVARGKGWREEGRECTRPRSAHVPPSSGPLTVGSSAAITQQKRAKIKETPPKQEQIRRLAGSERITRSTRKEDQIKGTFISCLASLRRSRVGMGAGQSWDGGGAEWGWGRGRAGMGAGQSGMGAGQSGMPGGGGVLPAGRGWRGSGCRKDNNEEYLQKSERQGEWEEGCRQEVLPPRRRASPVPMTPLVWLRRNLSGATQKSLVP